MTETQRRIRAYKDALPGLRERVVAVALLLAMSMAMMTSASFAWLTISRRPEVTGVNTTIASNGNLEIALATGDGLTPPGESKVGDSSATKGQSITASNITWGNLVNLGDPAYGLDNLTLRPAQLNKTALLTKPLYGAVYTADGRVEKLSTDFSYTAWIPPEGKTPGYFGMSHELGVRAVSSTKTEVVGFYANYLQFREAADIANVYAGNDFIDITEDADRMMLLAKLMGIHMTATLNGETQYKEALDKDGNYKIKQEDIIALRQMYLDFIEALKQEATAIANELNGQLYLAYGGNTSGYDKFDQAAVLALKETDSRIDADGDFIIKVSGTEKEVKITDMKSFLHDYNLLVTDEKKLDAIATGGNYGWKSSGLLDIVNRLVKINDCLLDGKKVSTLLSEFTSNPTSALGYRNKECSAVITNGVMYNFEKRTGTSMLVTKTNSNRKKGLPVEATMYVNTFNLGEVNATVYATITTSATDPSDFAKDLAYGDSLNTGADEGAGDVVAQDTYALAVDLWVRTNMESSYLVLEGNVLTVSEEKPVTGEDDKGNTVNLYTLSRVITEDSGATETTATGETTAAEVTETTNAPAQSVTMTYDLYKVETTENDTTTTTWYNAENHELFELQEGEIPKQKMQTVEKVTGFEGENRVWDTEDPLKSHISTDATTQGSGSCYVYYADTPEDQARSLELLKAMNVAFVDGTGKLLATASMDTDRAFIDVGRVIVPLKLDEDSLKVYEDAFGNVTYGITKLEKNVPTRITALVFLDGSKLSNQNVLAASDIQGKLNIQFGSTASLEPIDNETLESKIRKVSASVSNNKFDYDTHVGKMETTVTVTVEGDKPNKVTAFFLRQISSTQGSREEEMEFTYDEASNTWKAVHEFTTPGNYVLRTVQLDGVEYALDTRPTVTVDGFAIASLTCTQAKDRVINIMTADASTTVDLFLRFAAGTSEEEGEGSTETNTPKMPTSVQGRFLRSDGTAVNVSFKYNPTTTNWEGSATFLASGDYTFQYLILDGEYEELTENLWLDATISLGMRVAVYTTSPTKFKYEAAEMQENEKLLGMQVKIMDNAGQEVTGLKDVWLYYALNTDSIRVLDTQLTWNAGVGYYTGSLKTLESGTPGTDNYNPGAGYGVWQFKNVKIGTESTITNATTSPRFTMLAADPPFYSDDTSDPDTYTGYQKLDNVFSPVDTNDNNDVTMNANIRYSAGTEVWAVITNEKGEEFWVEGDASTTSGNVTTWRFKVPKNPNTKSQEGTWTMETLRIWNYLDANNNLVECTYGEDGKPDPNDTTGLTFEVTGNTVKVLSTINVSFANNEGNASKTLSGEDFMHTYSFNGINVDITDSEGNTLTDVRIGDVKLQYSYDGASMANGFYKLADTSSTLAKEDIFTLDFTSTDNSHFVQSAVQNVTYAGNYTPVKLTYNVYGNDGVLLYSDGYSTMPKVDAGILKVTVKSEKPTVTVTGVTPNETKRYYSVAVPSHINQIIEGNFSRKVDDFTALAFIYYDYQSGWADQEYYRPVMPKVTLKLEGITGTYSATMLFKNGTNEAYNRTFTFTDTKPSDTQSIGYGTEGSTSNWGQEVSIPLYPAGNQAVKNIIVEYDKKTFTVELSDEVTINQPTYPYYADFTDIKSIENTYTGATPSRVYTYDGEHIELPANLITWTDAGTETGSDATYGSWSQSTQHTDYAYKTYKPLIGSRKYYYQEYHWTKFERDVSGSQRTYVTTYTVTAWNVNGVQYPITFNENGDPNPIIIEVDGAVEVTAVISKSTVFGTWQSTTAKETKYGYVQGNETSTKPTASSAMQIGGTIGRYDEYPTPALGIADTSTAANMYSAADAYTGCSNRIAKEW